jgi:hypothetical protein
MLTPWLPRTPDAPARCELVGEPGWIAAERLDESAEVWDHEAGKWVQCRDKAEADRWLEMLYSDDKEESR